MAQWHCNLQPSRLLQQLSLLLHTLLALAVCLLPGMAVYWFLQPLLLAGIVLELILTRQGLRRMQGEFKLNGNGALYWNHTRYTISSSPLLLNFALAVPLRCSKKGKRSLLWLARESMSQQQWRALRLHLLQWRAQ